MADKQIQRFAGFPKGMMPALNRTEIPPDALFWAENVDLRTPGRIRLVNNDTMLAAGVVPDHVQVAQDDERQAWKWLVASGGAFNVPTFDVIFPMVFGGQTWIVAADYSLQKLYMKLKGTAGAWTEITTNLSTDKSRERCCSSPTRRAPTMTMRRCGSGLATTTTTICTLVTAM